MKKIFMIAPQPFFEPRGTPISVYQRLLALSELGHEVDLLTYHVGKDVNIPGINIHRTPNIPFIKSVKIGPSAAKLLMDVFIFFQAIVMLLKNYRYDAIHSHEEGAFIAAFLAPIFRTKHVYDMHSSLPKQLENFNFGNYWPVIKLFELLENWVVKTADAVITIGVDLEEYVYKLKPDAKHTRLENMPISASGNDRASLDARKAQLALDDKIAIVYTGTFESYQGLDLLFESAKLIKQNDSTVAFVMVGGKPDQVEYWKNEVKKLKIDDCVSFVGTVPLEEAALYLEIADILVSPRTSGLSVPLKIYSYLFSGKPVVATDVFAHTQILNDNIAVISKPEPQDFARNVIKLVQDPHLRETIGAQAREFATEKFSTKNYLSKLDWVYNQACGPNQLVEESTTSVPTATNTTEKSVSYQSQKLI